MLLSLNWLKDYVDIPASLKSEDLGLKFTLHTVEIEEVRDMARKFEKVTVGEILEVKAHPNADRLRLALVDIGKKKLNIVCGAPNIKPGQKVPVALVGAELPNGLKIEKAKVRGEVSEGMLCAEDELGLGDDHSGIMILSGAKKGQKLAEYLKIDDVVFEVDNKSVTNRPDLWGHHGMAREISVFLGSEFKPYENKALEILKNKDKKKIEVKIEDFNLCPRYIAIGVEGVEVKESPDWIKQRLIAVGVKPINNIVDATNYVMLDLGQPMHAFDADKVNKIFVRPAGKKEKIKTLDGVERELDNSMLVIADEETPIAIAGVMGGFESQITEKTKKIIIESANFDPYSIRKSAQKLGLRTDAAVRYEKSLDPNLCELAITRILEIIKESCPKAQISTDLTDEKKFSLDCGPIEIELAWLQAKIGKKITKQEVLKTFDNLGFETKEKEDDVFEVVVPSWRATKDISIAEDLLEEVARIHGYDSIEPKMPLVEMASPEINKERVFERKVKNILSLGAGLTEVFNYSFVGEAWLSKVGVDFSKHLRLANPISVNHTMLRQSLAPGIFGNIELNQSFFEKINIFEIGSVYFDLPGRDEKEPDNIETLPFQEKKMAIAEAGQGDVFEEVKKKIAYLADSLDFELVFEETENVVDWAFGSLVARVVFSGRPVGIIAEIDKKKLQKMGIKKSVALAELSFSEIFNLYLTKSEKKYQALSKFPTLQRDLAFVIDKKILYNNIKSEIDNFDALIEGVELFDSYEGDELGAGKKSLAFHIFYRSKEKTLTGEEVDKLQVRLIKNLEKKFGAKVRDF